MKKWLFILLTALMLVTALTLTACDGDDPSETDSDTTSDSESVSDSGPTSDTDSDTETESETEYDDPALALDHLSIGGLDISNYTVVVPANAATRVSQAADLLIRFVGEATGVTLNKITDAETAAHEIVLGVTNRDTEDMATRRANVQNDGYVMAVKDGNLYIQADIPRGTLFGVYDFLEDYVGVQLYGYDMTYKKESYEIKEHIRVDVPADLSVDYDAVLMQRHTDWSAKDNAGSVYPLWGTYNTNEVAYPACHTIGWILGLGFGVESASHPQPCLSDDTVYQTVLASVRADLANNPNLAYISITQADGDGIFRCRCSQCRAVEEEEGSPSGLWIRFVNRIANDIKDDYPNTYIETFAYSYTSKPPQVTRAASNVAVRLCSDHACNLHAFNDPNCPANAEFKETLEAWSKMCDHMMIWTYTANYATAGEYVESDVGTGNCIGPNIRVILQNARFFAENNVKSVYAQGKWVIGAASMELGELRTYLWGKAMWDPYMSEEEFEGYINDFVNYYYGEAGPLLLQYLDAINEMAGTYDENYNWGGGHTAMYTDNEAYFRLVDKNGVKHTEFFEEMKVLWEKMDAMTFLSEEQRTHMEAVGYHFWETCRTVYQDQIKLRAYYLQKCNSIMRKLRPST